MVKIRLMRVGKRKQPSYRVVVADARSARGGRIIESIGHYHPRQEPSRISIDTDRAVYWLQRGAQPSTAARNLLQLSGAWSAFTGEPAPEPAGTASPQAKPTPAASVSALRPSSDEAPGAQPPAPLPEAADQAPAAPDRPAGDQEP